jgi:hypothetical protein
MSLYFPILAIIYVANLRYTHPQLLEESVRRVRSFLSARLELFLQRHEGGITSVLYTLMPVLSFRLYISILTSPPK